MIKHVRLTSTSEEFPSDSTLTAPAGIISISDAEHPLPTLNQGWGAVLRLSFNDAEYTPSLIRTYGRVADFRDKHRHDPQADDAHAILQFLSHLEERGLSELVLYCENGHARSAAIARYVNRTCGATVSGGDITSFNDTLYYLLSHPMGFETILRNMERSEQEDVPQETESALGSISSKIKSLFR